jgi:hypothetical protein
MANIISQPTDVDKYRSYAYIGFDRDGQAVCGGAFDSFDALRAAMKRSPSNLHSYEITGMDERGFQDDITTRAASHAAKLDREADDRWAELEALDKANGLA